MPVAVAEAVPERRGGRRQWRRVAEVVEDWLVSDEWWRAEPVRRHYFRLLLADGAVLTVYRDLAEDRWYRQPYAAPLDDADGG